MAKNDRRGVRRQKDSEMAAMMKRLGIRRTSGRCCVCYRIIAVPTDRHFFGGNCRV